jgi:hypothetical protein
MQKRNFCTVLELLVVNGEPVLDPKPRIILQIRLSQYTGPRPEMGIADFALSKEHVAFFEFLDRFGNGTVAKLEVRDGKPVWMEVEETGSG